MRVLLAIASALLLWTAFEGRPLRADAPEPLVVIVHPRTPVDKLSAYEIEALFTRAQTRWNDGSVVYPFSFPAGDAVREHFDRVALRLTPDQVGRFWLDRRIRGLGLPPKAVPSASLMAQVIANLPGSIGYLPASHCRAGVKIVARIAQGKVLPP